MTRYLRFPLLLAVLLLTSYPASAQVTTGTPPFSSSGGGPDIIDQYTPDSMGSGHVSVLSWLIVASAGVVDAQLVVVNWMRS